MAHFRLATAPAVLLGLLLQASPGHAQEIPSPYRYVEHGQEAGGVAGYMSTDRGRFGFGPKSAAFYGASYAVAVSGPITLEGMLTFMPTERDVVNPRRVEGDRVLEDPAEVSLVDVSARLRFALTGRRTWNRLQPFAHAGAGLMFDAEGDQAEDDRLEEDERFDFGTRFVGVLGAGTRLLLTERLSLRADAGLTLYQLEIPEGWRDPELGLEDSPESEWVSGGTLTFGATFLF